MEEEVNDYIIPADSLNWQRCEKCKMILRRHEGRMCTYCIAGDLDIYAVRKGRERWAKEAPEDYKREKFLPQNDWLVKSILFAQNHE